MPYCINQTSSISSYPTLSLRVSFIPLAFTPQEYMFIDQNNNAFFYFDCDSESIYETTIGLILLRKYKFVFNYANNSLAIQIPTLSTHFNSYTFTLTPQRQLYPYYMLSQKFSIGSNSQQVPINFDQMMFSLSYIPTLFCPQCQNAVYKCDGNDTSCSIESDYMFTMQNNLFYGQGQYTNDVLHLASYQVPLIFLSVMEIQSSIIPNSLIVEGSFVLN